MIKRYCDKCGKEITTKDFRKLSMTTADDEYIMAGADTVFDTAKDIELCRECARKVLDLIENN